MCFLEEKEQSFFPFFTQSGVKNCGNPEPADGLWMRWNKGTGTIIHGWSVPTPERTRSGLWEGVSITWGFCRWDQVELCNSVSMQQPGIFHPGDTFVNLLLFPLLLPLSFQRNPNLVFTSVYWKRQGNNLARSGQQSGQSIINDQPTKISPKIPTSLTEKMGTAKAQGHWSLHDSVTVLPV